MVDMPPTISEFEFNFYKRKKAVFDGAYSGLSKLAEYDELTQKQVEGLDKILKFGRDVLKYLRCIDHRAHTALTALEKKGKEDDYKIRDRINQERRKLREKINYLTDIRTNPNTNIITNSDLEGKV